jgi:hypothetical protein
MRSNHDEERGMDDDDFERDEGLEQTIADLIERKYAAPKGSIAYRLAVSELRVLRYTREMAGPIMERPSTHFSWIVSRDSRYG